MNERGRKRKVNYEEVVSFAAEHPTMTQAEIAAHFSITQSRVSHILGASGVSTPRRGGPIQMKPSMTEDQFKWEKILHDCGLGMDRGLRVHNKRILYGYDTRKESLDDGSATRIAA